MYVKIATVVLAVEQFAYIGTVAMVIYHYIIASVYITKLHNIIVSTITKEYKARQTEFTVYRHMISKFTCRRAVIIQTSKQNFAHNEWQIGNGRHTSRHVCLHATSSG